MGLIKKSVSDIERKINYARIVMKVLKECHLVKEFIDYTKTQDYRYFTEKYMEKHTDCTDVWYDKEYCGNILGYCNFENYLEMRYSREKSRKYNTYHLVLCYLAIFDEDEFIRYYTYRDIGEINPQEYIEKALAHKNYNQGKFDEVIIIKWLRLKETLYGNKD